MKVFAKGLIERDVSLRPFNTFGVDVNAALFARVRSVEDLQRALADRSVADAPLLMLGGGSNVLFTQDFDGCVLKVEIAGVRHDDDGARWLVQVGGGENWHAIVERLMEQNMPRQWTPVIGYADVASELRDQNITQPQPRDVFNAVVAIRRRKLPDPAAVGNAGSFFKNPVISRQQRSSLIERHPSLVSYDIGGGRYKLAAGWLIDACGLKGTVRGRAAVYERQALVLVNLGGATGAEILALAREVQDAVGAKFGIELEPELRVI